MTRSIRVIVLSFLVLLPLALSASADPAEEGVIDMVKGDVKIVDNGGKSRPAKEDDYVLSGEEIQTGKDSFCRVLFADGSALEVQSGSRVEVADTRAAEGTMSAVILYIGRLWLEIEGVESGERVFEVETPTAVAGVRGTAFSVGVGIDGATRVGVDDGLVEVGSDVGSVEVGAGKETTVEWNAPPQRPGRYDRNEEAWRDWVQKRQERLVQNGDKIVPWVVSDVKRSRQNAATTQKVMAENSERLKEHFNKLEQRGQTEKAERQKKMAAARRMRAVYKTTADLARADRRMMARYQLVVRLVQEVENNSGDYSPEFIETVKKADRELAELDVAGVHEQNKKIIDRNVTAMRAAAEKYGLEGGGRNLTPEQRRAALEEARRKRRESRPDRGGK